MPQTGLTQLGNALLQGSGDYANIQLRRQEEERRRAQQLADLQDQRAFAVQQRGIERGYSLTDEARHRSQALDDETIQVLLKEGWLKPTDVRDPAAIKLASDARQARLNEAHTREGSLPAKLQQEADYLGTQDVQLSAVEDGLNAKLSAPPPSPPSPAEVHQVAIRMTGKPVPSDKEIADMLPAAQSEIMQQRLMQWSMEKEDAKNQVQLLRSQRTALRQSLTGLLQQGFVPNRPPPSPAQSLASPTPMLRPATAAQAAAAAGGGSAPPQAPTSTGIPTSGYGGVMGLMPEVRNIGRMLADPMGSAEIAGRTALSGPARLLNLLAGGERRATEGDVERAAGMADAIRRFNIPAPPRTPIPTAPFFGGFVPQGMPPLQPLPALPPPRRSPALQFGPVE